MKKVKYIKPKDEVKLVMDLQYIIMMGTNSKLISMPIHNLCKRFVKELKQIPLSQELQ